MDKNIRILGKWWLDRTQTGAILLKDSSDLQPSAVEGLDGNDGWIDVKLYKLSSVGRLSWGSSGCEVFGASIFIGDFTSCLPWEVVWTARTIPILAKESRNGKPNNQPPVGWTVYTNQFLVEIGDAVNNLIYRAKYSLILRRLGDLPTKTIWVYHATSTALWRWTPTASQTGCAPWPQRCLHFPRSSPAWAPVMFAPNKGAMG